MSESGKKTTTVISCTTFETIKVSDPIVFYEADRAHIIYMSRDNGKGGFYEDLVKDIKEQILAKREVEIIPHNSVVHRYSEMLRVVSEIIRDERERYGRFVDIYVNISSGSAEYAAAAMTACMMNPDTIPFTVRVKEHNITLEKFRELIEANGTVNESEEIGIRKLAYRVADDKTGNMNRTWTFSPPMAKNGPSAAESL